MYNIMQNYQASRVKKVSRKQKTYNIYSDNHRE